MAAKDEVKEKRVGLIKMHRKAPATGGPVEADVHPDEVDSYMAVGWQEGPAPVEEAAS